jgi:hypothetical protein
VADNQQSIEAPGWPGGWYVYENGRVDGPYSAEDAFNLSGETVDGKPRLVSRKGFTQWYALKDLSEIFRMTEQLGRRATSMTEAHLASEIARSKELRTAAASPSDGIDYAAALGLTGPAKPARPPTGIPLPTAASSVAAAAATPIEEQGFVPDGLVSQAPVSAPAAAPGKRKVDKAVKGRKSASLAEPVSSPSPIELREQHTETKRTRPAVIAGAAAETAPTREARTLTATKLTTKRQLDKAARAASPDMRQAVMQEFFLQRGRLRLGRLRNPFISGFVGLPFSLGVFWYMWFGDLARESAWHARGTNASPLPPTFLALIPLVHVFMIYKLAQLVSEMETQNHYRNVSPALAAALSIFPPAALAYLQNAANKHWLLHVKHAVARKQAMPA